MQIMAELTEESIAAIVEHMNADHGDSVLDYARHYGELDTVDAAELRSFDEGGMTIVAFAGGEKHVLSVGFDHDLKDTDDARDTLIAMARTAAKKS